MGKSKKIPLASGLIGREARSIHSQLEVSLINYDTVNIAIRRKVYSGLSDVKFSVADTDLKDIIDILNEAAKKIDTYWLSKVAVKSQGKKRKIKQ
ncbi:MAG: hypothetical protein OEZ35_07465 [Candidatus Bathyarchaeota archaeon]|nr:hypothetical protein [Candidatus Bathyarchaeota archaeon]